MQLFSESLNNEPTYRGAHSALMTSVGSGWCVSLTWNKTKWKVLFNFAVWKCVFCEGEESNVALGHLKYSVFILSWVFCSFGCLRTQFQPFYYAFSYLFDMLKRCFSILLLNRMGFLAEISHRRNAEKWKSCAPISLFKFMNKMLSFNNFSSIVIFRPTPQIVIATWCPPAAICINQRTLNQPIIIYLPLKQAQPMMYPIIGIINFVKWFCVEK